MDHKNYSQEINRIKQTNDQTWPVQNKCHLNFFQSLRISQTTLIKVPNFTKETNQ
jgi:hypothetical protein